MSFDRVETVNAASGAALRLYRSEAPEPRGVVQINHGLAEHAERYGRFAQALAERGYHTLAHDHRGHGGTKAPGAPLGRFSPDDGDRLVLEDAAAVLDLAAEEYPGLPVICFGHSMGGLVALNLVQRFPEKMQAAAIWNANFSAGLQGRLARVLLGLERFRMGSDVPSHILPRLTFQAWGKAIPQARTPFDWLSHDPDEVDAYIADPLCGWDASVSLWQDLFALIFAGADDARFGSVPKSLPLQLVGGMEDPATENGKATQALRRRLERLGFSNLETRLYEETRHESLNALNRNIITSDFLAWADRVTARR
ncbi:alpha/beta hydrolase [Tianweitania sp. BSSL-BM11]|uniref:Alpha/beta hydrolase n=1 Tax=Tianweitania aestuarii TaxID=2814886 RepID=A0ABS5RXA9_9HYPH|nr:alpha/beta hydrolase [Tianweitania aestuarii]MBS9720947.1 alpha/beta hydrolase [Tianweitania aestuarii]